MYADTHVTWPARSHVERDYIMTAEQVKGYGVIDEVIRKRASGACALSPQRRASELILRAERDDLYIIEGTVANVPPQDI